MSPATDVRRARAATGRGAPATGPVLLGLPALLPGGITLGLWLAGRPDASAPPGTIVPAACVSGLFLLVACVWAAVAGQGVTAAVLGTFAAFWLSFGFLLLGLANDWFGTAAGVARDVPTTFALSWLIVFLTVTLATLRLPLAFTAGLVFVCATLALVLGFVRGGNPFFATLGAITTFVFCAIYAYVFLDGMNRELGGRPMPLGEPLRP